MQTRHPLGFGLFLSLHRESKEADPLLDDPKDGSDGLLALFVYGNIPQATDPQHQ